MPIVRSKIRSSLWKMLFIVLLSCSCFFVLMYYCGKVCQEIDFTDLTSLCLLIYAVVSVVLLTTIFHLLLVFGVEYWTISSIINHLAENVCLSLLTCLDIFISGCLVLLCFHRELKLHWEYFLFSICASVLFACVLLIIDYDDVEISSFQNMKKSIGNVWAIGAYNVYYKEILAEITKRMAYFEKEENITFFVKKLVIICPLSCNVNGTLEYKDGAMQIIGTLKEMTFDDGGANRRKFKTNVYKICGPEDKYIAAETPSPLAILYEMRDVLDSIILEYHRDCFIETLKNLTKSENCIILEYDDINSPEELHSFLLSRLEDKKVC